MSTPTGIKAYANVGFESDIAGADPYQLIMMLYEAALQSVETAKKQIGAGNIEAKSTAIKRATAIIDQGLKASLDVKAGGQIATNLQELYEYMVYRLLVANLKNDLNALNEVERLLTELKAAWEGIGQQVKQSATNNAAETVAKPSV